MMRQRNRGFAVQYESGMMILISNGGSNIHRAQKRSDTIVVGTVDGVAVLARGADGWAIKHRALAGCFVSAVTALDDGTLFAATHGVGVARSEDGGRAWAWCNNGLAHFDLWSARGGKLHGRDVVLVGSLPAHVYLSEDAERRQMVLPAAAAHRPRQGHRAGRRSAAGRR
jgi:hypothetical protein